MSHSAREIEIKLAVPDAGAARRFLRAAGFRVSRPRVFESNTVFDTPESSLRQAGTLLRIRQAGGMSTITYKGGALAGKHKSREELEMEVSSAGVLAAIFGRLELLPVFRYEKYRTEFRQPRHAGVAMLDEIPIGVYLELEGTPAWIDRTARRLGFEEKHYITVSYSQLYLQWCQARRRKPSNMVFPARSKRLTHASNSVTTSSST
jgi:adenylate cyclase class 2